MVDYDIIIVGAGVVGSSIARELSRYDARVCVLEKCTDVCEGTSKANSAIVHAGFDAVPGTLKAALNAAGNKAMDRIAEELAVPFKRCGAFVVSLHEEDLPKLRELKERGIQNGITGLEILGREEALKLEPNLSDDVYAALHAPSSGIICPFELTLGFAENAKQNGVDFVFQSGVTAITKTAGGYNVETERHAYSCRALINAAGVYSDTIHNMVCENKIEIIARRGEYILLDKTAGDHVSRTIFQLPGVYGKGVLVSPTVHGNLIVGPTSEDIDDKEATKTTRDALADIVKKSAFGVKNVPLRQAITSFSGLRAHSPTDDFIIGESAPFFFDAAAIESPGLSAVPAIGERIAEMVKEKLSLAKNERFNPLRPMRVHVSELPVPQRRELIEKNGAYGSIVCRCEQISEGEIRDAINGIIGATTLDGVKRRTRAGMGRCQSGFCSPRVMVLLAESLGTDLTGTRKNSPSSLIVYEKTREDT